MPVIIRILLGNVAVIKQSDIWLFQSPSPMHIVSVITICSKFYVVPIDLHMILVHCTRHNANAYLELKLKVVLTLTAI